MDSRRVVANLGPIHLSEKSAYEMGVIRPCGRNQLHNGSFEQTSVGKVTPATQAGLHYELNALRGFITPDVDNLYVERFPNITRPLGIEDGNGQRVLVRNDGWAGLD